MIMMIMMALVVLLKVITIIMMINDNDGTNNYGMKIMMKNKMPNGNEGNDQYYFCRANRQFIVLCRTQFNVNAKLSTLTLAKIKIIQSGEVHLLVQYS